MHKAPRTVGNTQEALRKVDYAYLRHAADFTRLEQV